MDEKKKNVVYADDDAPMRQAVGAMLDLAGADVQLCKDGAEAIERCRAHPPDVLLLDLEMPNVDGFQAAAAVRANPSCHGTRVLALTGRALASVAERARGAGFERVLPKPIDFATLVQALELGCILALGA